ncbi:hypothetical protein U1Q18_043190 [Sarracenia purpurea var. burkii]
MAAVDLVRAAINKDSSSGFGVWVVCRSFWIFGPALEYVASVVAVHSGFGFGFAAVGFLLFDFYQDISGLPIQSYVGNPLVSGGGAINKSQSKSSLSGADF